MTSDVQIRFLRFRGRHVACAVNGAGPPLVAPAWWVSHLELDWRDAAFRSFWESVSAGHTLVRYDHPGVGISDREIHDADLTLEAEVALLVPCLDELSLERVTLLGGSSGGCAAVAFAARFPQRVERLLLYGAYLDGGSIVAAEARAAIVGTVRSHWGLGARVLADIFLGDAGCRRARAVRAASARATSAEAAASLLELVYRLDVHAEADQVRAPTLVVHRRADRAIPYEQGRALAAAIPGAALIPLEGSAHLPWVGDAQSVVRVALVGPRKRAVGQVPRQTGEALLSSRQRARSWPWWRAG